MNPLGAESDLGYQSNRLTRLLRAHVSRGIAPLGITARQAAVLMCLAGTDSLSMGELASSLDMDRATLTGVTDRLRRDGWLEVVVSDVDRRRRLVRLATGAHDRLPQLLKAARHASRTATSALTADETALLLRLLARASDSLEADLESPDTSRKAHR